MATGRKRVRLPIDLSQLFRRYFINTLFDSTFVVLGIVSAAIVAPERNIPFTLGTLAAACLAIGISTGLSVYEAERVETEIKMAKLERAMLTDLADTDVHRSLQAHHVLVSLVNLAAPLVVFAITSIPFVLHLTLDWPGLAHAAQASIALAVILVFVSGYALGRLLGGNPLRQGLRMTIAAMGTFIILVLVQTYLL